MAYTRAYESSEPPRSAVEAWPGLTLLEFGAPWCGHCIGAQSALQQVLANRPELRHVKIEDGSGRPLGRSFRVKLWPTLVLLRDGQELARRVRPTERDEIEQLLAAG